MTRVTVFINAALFDHSRVRSAMGVVTIGAGYLSLPLRHVRAAVELGFFCRMALGTDCSLGPFDEEVGPVVTL